MEMFAEWRGFYFSRMKQENARTHTQTHSMSGTTQFQKQTDKN